MPSMRIPLPSAVKRQRQCNTPFFSLSRIICPAEPLGLPGAGNAGPEHLAQPEGVREKPLELLDAGRSLRNRDLPLDRAVARLGSVASCTVVMAWVLPQNRVKSRSSWATLARVGPLPPVMAGMRTA